MKHNNKYALALVLLASYVFAVEGSGADENPSTEIPEKAVKTLPDHDHSTGANENKNTNNLNDWQIILINAAEEALGKSLPKDQLNEFLRKPHFHFLDAEIRAKAILVLAKENENWTDDKVFAFALDYHVRAIRSYESKNGVIPDKEFIIKILNLTEEELLANETAISDSPDTLVVADENKQNEKSSSQKDTKSKEDKTTKRITEDELVAATKAVDAAAQRQLASTASTTPPASDSKGADLNSSGSGSGDKSEKAEVPFYKNAWIMVPSGVILLSVIGGGVFMMTRKTEETDL